MFHFHFTFQNRQIPLILVYIHKIEKYRDDTILKISIPHRRKEGEYIATIKPGLWWSNEELIIEPRSLSLLETEPGRNESSHWTARLPTAAKRRISSPWLSRARLIDRATYADMCRDTYRNSCTHTVLAQRALGYLNQPPIFPPSNCTHFERFGTILVSLLEDDSWNCYARLSFFLFELLENLLRERILNCQRALWSCSISSIFLPISNPT